MCVCVCVRERVHTCSWICLKVCSQECVWCGVSVCKWSHVCKWGEKICDQQISVFFSVTFVHNLITAANPALSSSRKRIILPTVFPNSVLCSIECAIVLCWLVSCYIVDWSIISYRVVFFCIVQDYLGLGIIKESKETRRNNI